MNSTPHFDQAAATWDENPIRQALTAAVAAGIRQALPLSRRLTMLEYGCGTASLSMLLSATVGQITALDASAGMVAQARLKVAAAQVATIRVMHLDLTTDPAPDQRFDLAAAAMVLHHVADTRSLLGSLRALLRPGGAIALADLCPEDGSFHGDMQVPHPGLDPAVLAAMLEQTGFTTPSWNTVHTIAKQGRLYPVFLLTARRRQA